MRIVASLLVASCLIASAGAQTAVVARAVRLAASDGDLGLLRQADASLSAMLRDGRLTRTQRVFDAAVQGAEHHRLQQRHDGVPVWAGDVVVQERGGSPVSIYGELFTGLDALETTPRLSPVQAREATARYAGVELGPAVAVRLFVRARDGEAPRLVYAVRATRRDLLTWLYFIDAHTGALVEERLDTRLQAAIGVGTGVVPGERKISAALLGGLFVAEDLLRPQGIQTYDMRGDTDAVLALLNGTRELTVADLAADDDNRWTDAAAFDAHVYSGWAVDYLFKRFGYLREDRRPIVNIVHPAHLEDYFERARQVPQFYADAGYYGGGVQIFGDGLPEGVRLPTTEQGVGYLSAALDIVAHEVMHGLTEHLEYVDEPGALTETLSDALGTATEFYFQRPVGSRGSPDYHIGEDAVTFGAIRSMSSPGSVNNFPDHYTRLFRGREDNGGVHINAGIGNYVFYLAIEGGVHDRSRVEVTGVGAANREQIERVFFRAFTLMLPARATFSVARDATIQAARDLYGEGSAAEHALTDAWTAVGVQ